MADRVNLVADLGEGFGRYVVGDDDAMLDLISSANIACGFHAGDPRIMRRTVSACLERGVAIGAHPGLPDLVGFGRRTVDCTADEVYTDVLYQVGALAAFVRASGGTLAHLTPHGKLGNLTRRRDDYAEAVVRAVADFDPGIRIVSRQGKLTDTAASFGLPCGYTGFADRAYGADGELVPRSVPGSVIHDKDEVARRVVRMVRDGVVTTADGNDIPAHCDTILLHGDTAGAVELAGSVVKALTENQVAVRPLSS